MKKIFILFSTTSESNAKNLMESIFRTVDRSRNPNYNLSVVLFDKTTQQEIHSYLPSLDVDVQVVGQEEICGLENKYSEYFVRANCCTKTDSIQRARIQQQVYILDNKPLFEDAIIWQVDDDMLFGQSKYLNNEHLVEHSRDYFSEIVSFSRKNRDIDALIAPSSYVPPIPALLYCQSQLIDIFTKEYREEDIFDSEYHDFYNSNDQDGFYTLFLSKESNILDLTKQVLVGKPITRVSNCTFEDEIGISLNSKLLRGGNFVVFNINVFNVPHLGYTHSDSFSARRSDMIHAHLLREVGFNIADTSYFCLVHNRQFNDVNLGSCAKKYLKDMIGALLIQYIYHGVDFFEKRWIFHQNHVQSIIQLLVSNIEKGKLQNEIIILEELDKEIAKVDKNCLIEQFEQFRMKQENLKEDLCKLA